MLSLENEISILNKYKITSDELMFIRTLLILQDDGDEDLFGKYLEALHESNVDIRGVLNSLQQKGAVLHSYTIPPTGAGFDPYSIPLNKNFVKNIYRCSFEMGKELFEVYPQFGVINNSTVSLRTVARHFESLEDAYMSYAKSIRWKNETHKEIIELLEWAKEFNILSQSLSSFIINHSWIDLKALKDGENGANVNYNSIKLL